MSDEQNDANEIEWLPILLELGEKGIRRWLDKSPDTKTAILEAREEFRKAKPNARDLASEGHGKTDPQ